MQFRKHFLLYTLSPLIFLLISASFFRFIISQDYIVAFEGECDPLYNNCFIGCIDEECKETYYFLKVHKHAADIYAQCGKDISMCETTNVCDSNEGDRCSLIYCNVETDGDLCEKLDATSVTESS